jgi:hypothetical protein
MDSLKRTVERALNVALVFLIALTAYNFVVAPHLGNSETVAEVGSRLEIDIRSPSSGSFSRVSDEGAGQCRMVVVYDPTCGGCAAASERWRRDLLRETDPTGVAGRNWHVYWLSVTPEVFPDSLRPPDTLVPHWVTVSTEQLMHAVRLHAVPTSLVLDRTGAVVATHEGAVLKRRETFKDNCTISQDEGSPRDQS